MDGLVALVAIAIPLAFVYLAFAMIRAISGRSRNMKALRASGFRFDHVLSGNVVVVFDDAARTVAFVYWDAVEKFPYAAISSWEWDYWTDRGRRIRNALHFHLNDKDTPLIKVGNLSSDEAEHWNAKLRPLLSG